MNESMSELKPCPCCGKKDNLYYAESECPGEQLVGCSFCEVEIHANNWNTRQLEDELRATIAKMDQSHTQSLQSKLVVVGKLAELDAWRQLETILRCALVDRLRYYESTLGLNVDRRAPVELRGSQPGGPCRISPYEVARMEHEYACEVLQALVNKLAEASGAVKATPLDPNIQCGKCGHSRHVFPLDLKCSCCGADFSVPYQRKDQ